MTEINTSLPRGSNEEDELVTHEFPLDWIDEAFENLLSPPSGFIKGIIVP